jgi:hypothetical protein
MPGTKGRSGGKRPNAGRKPLYTMHYVDTQTSSGWIEHSHHRYHAPAVATAKELLAQGSQVRIVSYLVPAERNS